MHSIFFNVAENCSTDVKCTDVVLQCIDSNTTFGCDFLEHGSAVSETLLGTIQCVASFITMSCLLPQPCRTSISVTDAVTGKQCCLAHTDTR